MNEGNIIRVGKKPILNYVTACVTLFNSGVEEVRIKARGSAISKAVDTVELLKRAFLKDLVIGSINVGSESIVKHNGDTGNVSIIEIVLKKA
ncbi:MAG: DNA-binding protein Alba [Candidatus Bathyarchaeia archaeon]